MIIVDISYKYSTRIFIILYQQVYINVWLCF